MSTNSKSSESCSCVSLLLQKISNLRKKQSFTELDSYVMVSNVDKHAWARIFAEFFLVNAHCTKSHCSFQTDDILWYVPQSSFIYNSFLTSQSGFIKVYRKTSKKQPSPGSQSINWEETLYLNLLLHEVEYVLTCAVCTRTSPQNLQILKKYSQRVYASPSRHRMDSKGESEEFTYPNICFPVDNFEQVFKEIVIRDGECVCVELVAKDLSGQYVSTVFLGSIRYEVLKQVYDSKICSTWNWANNLIRSTGHKRLEFVIMRGPRGKGFAEMAVARVPVQGYQTPVSSIGSYDEKDLLSAVKAYQRRRSDTNLSRWSCVTSSFYENYKSTCHPVKKCPSETDTNRQWPEVEASTIDDEIGNESLALGQLWSTRGFSQAWHRLREKRRADCVPLNAHLTYITLPWSSIVADLMDGCRTPLLTFDKARKMTSPQDKQSVDKAKSGSGQSDDASFDAFNEGSVYSMMYSMAESQYVGRASAQAGPSMSKELEDELVQKMAMSKFQQLEKVKLTGRRVILIRNAERVDRIFPDWMNMAFDANGKYQPYDLNQPLSLPNRTGSFHQFRYDAPITELGCVVSMMIGRALKFNNQHPQKVFTSPALRCIQSCKNILKAMGNSELKMCIEPAFFEWLSWYEVLPDWISEDDLMKSNYKIDNNYKPILSREEIRNRRNESHIAFYDRCIQAFKNILEIENKPGYMLFVVHSLTMDAISRHLNARKTETILQSDMQMIGGNYPYCSVLVYEELADKTWRLVPRAMPSLTYMDFTSRVNFEFVRRN
ncbi:Uncharacterized protein T08_1779 [Trichinella sp. T8]|nr:Uncharacterized protein T08_1779 [Trichinella sp. T8]